MLFSKEDAARAMYRKIALIRKKGLYYPGLAQALDLVEKKIAGGEMPLKWHTDMGLVIDALFTEVQYRRPRDRCVYGLTNDAIGLIERTVPSALIFLLAQEFQCLSGIHWPWPQRFGHRTLPAWSRSLRKNIS